MPTMWWNLRIRSPIALAIVALSFLCSPADAAMFFWTDWTSSTGGAPFTAQGTITTTTSTVNVNYTNPLGVSFFQDGVGIETDYWAQGQFGALGRNPDRSPYTSALVENIPTGTDIVALNRAGNQTLTFSQTIANPVFSYVSLNGNGYAFLNRDFEILSFG